MADADNPSMHSTYMDYPEHERTYRAFTFGAKWGTLGLVIVILLMAFFLL
jgi:hypothetical protein